MQLGIAAGGGGLAVRGVPEVRADRPRLVDFLNSNPLPVFPLFATDRLHLVAMSHIAYAHPVD